jgi:hypothetical protein
VWVRLLRVYARLPQLDECLACEQVVLRRVYVVMARV